MTKGAISLSVTFDTAELEKLCGRLCSAVAELPFLTPELEIELRAFLANPLGYFEVERRDGSTNYRYTFTPKRRFYELLDSIENVQRHPDMQFFKRLSERVDRLDGLRWPTEHSQALPEEYPGRHDHDLPYLS